jgi:hypothetical protein
MEQLWSNGGAKGRKRSAPASRENGENEPKTVANRCAYFALRAAWLEAVAALGRGKTVEQLLSAESHGGQPTVRWLSVYPHDDAFVVGLHHVFDPCDPELLDVTEFAPVDEWEGVGEGVEMARAGDPEVALRDASALGAVPKRWVNEFVVAEEYRDAHGRT